MPIKIDELLKIFLEMKQETAYFLDIKTGKIIGVGTAPTPTEIKLLKEKTIAGTLVKIPRYPSSDNYKDMEEFIPTLNNIQLQKRLMDALKSGGNASRFFKDALMSHSREKEKWNNFRAERIKSFINQFLKTNGLL